MEMDRLVDYWGDTVWILWSPEAVAKKQEGRIIDGFRYFFIFL